MFVTVHCPSVPFALDCIPREGQVDCGAHEDLLRIYPHDKNQQAFSDPPQSPFWNVCNEGICCLSYPWHVVLIRCTGFKLNVCEVKEQFGASVKIVHVDIISIP